MLNKVLFFFLILDIQKHLFQTIFEQENIQNEDLRFLQFSNIPQPIRVTAGYEGLNIKLGQKDGITEKQKNYIIKIVEACKFYFQRLVKVYRLQENNKFPSFENECKSAIVSQQDKDIGIPNSDYHLYVIYENQPKSSKRASAGSCQFFSQKQVGVRRPSFGRVIINIGKMYESELDDFETYNHDMEIVIHEILHAFGFINNYKYWFNPITNSFYGQDYLSQLFNQRNQNGNITYFLASKNVLEVTKRYYNCPTAKGMQLENGKEGYQGPGSHWDLSVLYNEVMNSVTSQIDASLSAFTIALLKDTGYYAEVNNHLAEDIYWGKGQGCDFLENLCRAKNNKFAEFLILNTQTQCTFESDGMGVWTENELFDGCKILQPDNYCADTKKSIYNQNSQDLTYYSTQSKCLQSTVYKSSFRNSLNARCHKIQCASDFSYITVFFPVQNYSFVCKQSQQGQEKKIDFVSNFERIIGSVFCPNDYQKFCKFNNICPNHCSQNGVCIRRQCHCFPGYGEIDCSVKCEIVENGKCVKKCSQGMYLNPDNTCKPQCPKYYYKKNGLCQECHNDCSQCTGPSNNECTDCSYPLYLQGAQCVSQCDSSKGYKLDIQKEICIQDSSLRNQFCQANCQMCDTNYPSVCYACKKGYFVKVDDQGKIECVNQNGCPLGQYANIQTNRCQQLFNGCIQQKDFQACIKCDKQYRLNSDGLCVQCQDGCKECDTQNPQICFKCEYFRYQGQQLNQCPTVGTYVSGCQCLKCIDGCKYCSNGQSCDTCEDNLFYDQNMKICKKKLQAGKPK